MQGSPLIACPDCDLLQREVPLPQGGSAHCARCGISLYRSARSGLHTLVALTAAALLFFLIANSLPIAELDLGGQDRETTLLGAINAVYEQGMWEVALLVLVTTIIAPVIEITAMAYMLVPLWLGHCPRYLSAAFRIAPMAHNWGLVDVFMLGVAVSLVKLGDLAHVIPGPALWSFGALIVSLTTVGLLFDPREIWLHAEAITSIPSARAHAESAR